MAMAQTSYVELLQSDLHQLLKEAIRSQVTSYSGIAVASQGSLQALKIPNAPKATAICLENLITQAQDSMAAQA